MRCCVGVSNYETNLNPHAVRYPTSGVTSVGRDAGKQSGGGASASWVETGGELAQEKEKPGLALLLAATRKRRLCLG